MRGLQKPQIYRRVETGALKLRQDQRERTKQQGVKSEGGPGFKFTPGQRQVQTPGRPEELPLCLLQMDRSTEEFNLRTTVDLGQGVSPLPRVSEPFLVCVGSQGLSRERTAQGLWMRAAQAVQALEGGAWQPDFHSSVLTSFTRPPLQNWAHV